MLISSPGVRASQFVSFPRVDMTSMQELQGKNTGVVEHGIRGQVPENLDRNDAVNVNGGILVDNQVDQQDKVPVDGVDGGVVDVAVDQQPVVSSKRTRKPNGKYDPAVYDLSSVEMREDPIKWEEEWMEGGSIGLNEVQGQEGGGGVREI